MSYTGKSGTIEIKWDGKSTKTVNPVYIHQIPLYRVTFTLSANGLKATFDDASNLYNNYMNGWNDGRTFNFKVGFLFNKIINGNTTSITISSNSNWSWISGVGANKLEIYKSWNELGITDNITNYLTSTKYITFKPLCVGCDSSWNILKPFIDDTKYDTCPVSADKFIYKIIPNHVHINNPTLELSSSGTTITTKVSDTSCKVGIVNTKTNTVSKWYSVDNNKKYIFTGLSRGKNYKIRVKKICSCGNAYYADGDIHTWSIIDRTEESQNTYHQLTFSASHYNSTNTVSSNKITYNLYEIKSDGTIGTQINDGIEASSSSTATFNNLKSATTYLCKAYSTGGIQNKNGEADNYIVIKRTTGSPYKVNQNINYTYKDNTLNIILNTKIYNLDHTYILDNKNIIKGLYSLCVDVQYYDSATNEYKSLPNKSSTQENIKLQEGSSAINILNTFEINTETYKYTTFRLVCNYTGYSKYGINNKNIETEIHAIEKISNDINIGKEIILDNLSVSNKAVKFDLNINKAESNYDYYIIELCSKDENNKYVNIEKVLKIKTNSALIVSKKVQGITFGVYHDSHDNVSDKYKEVINSESATKILSEEVINSIKTVVNLYPSSTPTKEDIDLMIKSAGIKCDTEYEIKVRGVKSDYTTEGINSKWFKTNFYNISITNSSTQDSIYVHFNPLNYNRKTIVTDDINLATEFNPIESNDLGDITIIPNVDYQNYSLNQLIYDETKNPNGLLSKTMTDGEYNYRSSIRKTNFKSSKEIKEKQIDMNFSYSNLLYYALHNIKIGFSDGYNEITRNIKIATTFPYIRMYNGTKWCKVIPYIYNHGEWYKIVPHIYDSKNNKWRIANGDKTSN